MNIKYHFKLSTNFSKKKFLIKIKHFAICVHSTDLNGEVIAFAYHKATTTQPLQPHNDNHTTIADFVHSNDFKAK